MSDERKEGFRCQGERAGQRAERTGIETDDRSLRMDSLGWRRLKKKVGMTNDEQGMTLFVIRYSI